MFSELTYKIRGIIFKVKKEVGLGHKELVYHNALAEEFRQQNIRVESEKIIDIYYGEKKIGIYRPDFVIENKILLEIKVLPILGPREERQIWQYLKGSEYKLALLVNFGAEDIQIKRLVYDKAREK